jgi:uncharacterized protein
MNRVVWFEIHADDPARAMRFYESLLGWQFTKFEGDGPAEYWTIKTGDPSVPGIDGGLLKRMGGSGDKVISFVSTVAVADLGAMLDKATGLGAQVAVPRMHIPTVGDLAYIKDPDDNLLGLIQPDMSAR